ncbi:flavin reductase family protein [Deinococcus cellulosilyticus]|uniref:Oxidoreductase n=1 Tax=Deinococcus cellulosilyticus (strain DSM 18568 / NBRC 106333 / KACC 11606 / 5516J-15) TaxID=1223518 RepID=A0A511NAM7_DEIC1|nr:flavin reductase family protein [Deinococcus cellulosilyticus]GEM49863.1 oxidoreductase [Deinococcus cellulosilyticus NBRC 106333 = KACC 11606]
MARLERTDRFFGYYPATVAVITVQTPGARNLMSAGWHSAVSMHPPMYGVAVGPERATHPLLREAGRFAVNFLPFEFSREIQGAGVYSYHDGRDKFDRLGLKVYSGALDTLILEEAYLAYEIDQVQFVPFGDHDWVVGEVRQVHYHPEAFEDFKLTGEVAAVYLGRATYQELQGEVRTHPPELFRDAE